MQARGAAVRTATAMAFVAVAVAAAASCTQAPRVTEDSPTRPAVAHTYLLRLVGRHISCLRRSGCLLLRTTTYMTHRRPAHTTHPRIDRAPAVPHP